jgi:hypothetical protein
MSLASNLSDLATRVATECKALRTLINGNAADLSTLTTASKANLVGAVNELKAALGQSGTINDAATGTGSTWSSSKIAAQISSSVAGVVGGSSAALDTLNELASALANDPNFSTTMTTALGNRVRVDAAQTLTTQQQQQARDNIGAVSAAAVGDTATNFVTVFDAGLV